MQFSTISYLYFMKVLVWHPNSQNFDSKHISPLSISLPLGAITRKYYVWHRMAAANPRSGYLHIEGQSCCQLKAKLLFVYSELTEMCQVGFGNIWSCYLHIWSRFANGPNDGNAWSCATNEYMYVHKGMWLPSTLPHPRLHWVHQCLDS